MLLLVCAVLWGGVAYKTRTLECYVCRGQQSIRTFGLVKSVSTNDVCGEFCSWYRSAIDPQHIHKWLLRADVKHGVLGKPIGFAYTGSNRYLWQIPPNAELELFRSGFTKEQVIALTGRLEEPEKQQMLYDLLSTPTNRNTAVVVLEAFGL